MILLLVAATPKLAGATADGPDTFRVVGTAANETIAMRVRPGEDAGVVGSIPDNADGLANLGCIGGLTFREWQNATPEQRKAADSSRWCRVGFDQTVGWVAGRYLAEGSGTDRFGGGKLLTVLAGSEWQLRDFAGERIQQDVWIGFTSDGRAHGFGGCNRFNSSYTEQASKLSFGPVAATRMACPDPVEKVEQKLFRILGVANTFVASDKILTLISSDNEILASFLRRGAAR